MLPDYPKTKTRLLRWFKREITAIQKKSGRVVDSIRIVVVQEGDKNCIFREDGTVGRESLNNRIQAAATVKWEGDEAAPLLGLDDYRKLAKDLADDMTDKRSAYFFQSVNRTVEEYNQVIKGTGSAVERIFAMHDGLLMDFNEDGSPRWPRMLLPSEDAVNEAEDARREIENTPALKARMIKLLHKKRQEWRDREIARNLVE